MKWVAVLCVTLAAAFVGWHETSGQYAVRVGASLYVAERPKGLKRKVWRLRVGEGPAQVVGEDLE